MVEEFPDPSIPDYTTPFGSQRNNFTFPGVFNMRMADMSSKLAVGYTYYSSSNGWQFETGAAIINGPDKNQFLLDVDYSIETGEGTISTDIFPDSVSLEDSIFIINTPSTGNTWAIATRGSHGIQNDQVYNLDLDNRTLSKSWTRGVIGQTGDDSLVYQVTATVTSYDDGPFVHFNPMMDGESSKSPYLFFAIHDFEVPHFNNNTPKWSKTYQYKDTVAGLPYYEQTIPVTVSIDKVLWDPLAREIIEVHDNDN